MQVIREKTEQELLTALNRVTDEYTQAARCLRITLSDKEQPIIFEESVLIDMITVTLSEDKLAFYLCDDGDVFIIAPRITHEEIQNVQDKLYVLLNYSLEERFKVYELKRELSLLKLCVEEKIALRAAQHENLQKEHHAKQDAARKVEILNTPIDASLTSSLHQRRTSRKKPEIMVVEDDMFSCQLVKKSLSKDYMVSVVHNGEDAIMSYFLKAPDILFLDIELPDITGLDVLHKIQQHDDQAFIVMLSGNSDKEHVMKAVSQGAKGFVGKPFARKNLLDYIGLCSQTV